MVKVRTNRVCSMECVPFKLGLVQSKLKSQKLC